MCRVLGKVELTDFLIFIGLIKGPVFVKQRCLDAGGRRPMLKHSVKINAKNDAA